MIREHMTDAAVVVKPGFTTDEEMRFGLHAEGCGSPMQHPLWIRTSIDTFAPDAEVCLIGTGSARLHAIAPLVRHSSGELFEMPGVSELYEPMDFLYSDPAALPPLCSALSGLRTPLFLRRIPADSPVIPALKHTYGTGGILMCRPVAGYPWLPLAPQWGYPESQLSSSRASDLRRAQRIASRIGSIRYEFITPSADQLDSLLHEAFVVEARSWKGQAGTDLSSDVLRGPFYRKYAAGATGRRMLRLCFMRIDGAPAAMQMGVVCGNRFWLLKSSYDESYARCSPGMLLLLETLRYACRSGLSSFEFLGTAEPWTRMWTRRVRPCVSVRAYPVRVRGLAALAFQAARFSLKKIPGFEG